MSRHDAPLGFIDTVALTAGRGLLIALGVVASWLTLGKLARRHFRFPAPAFAGALFGSPFRRALQPPEDVLAPLGIVPGMTVLEVGPGPGTFTIEAARRAAPGGRVIAVDVQEGMLAQLRQRAERFGVSNVEPRVADAHHLPLADGSVDVAFMVGVLAEIPDPPRALAEVRRVLRPSGLVAVSEVFPDPDYPRPATTRRWLRQAGFAPVSQSGGMLWYVITARPLPPEHDA